MQDMIKRHLKSEGFQRRLINLYIPTAKILLAQPYNWLHAKLNETSLADEYETDKDIEDEEMPDSAAELPDSARAEPLTEEEAVEMVKAFLINHEDQDFGMCVTHSIKNIYRFAIKVIGGGDSDFSEHDIYIDRESRAREIDGGMSSSKTLDRVIRKGVAVAGVVPDPVEKEDLNTDRSDYPDSMVAPFRVKLLKSRTYIKAENDFNSVWNYIVKAFNERGVRPFQMSITARRGWWASDVPAASGKTYGGHSAIGLTIPFLYRGKRAFFCFDSSYRKGQVWRVAKGVRIVTEDCWNGLGRAIRPIEYVNAVESQISGLPTIPVPTPDPVVPKPDPNSIHEAYLNDENTDVEALQRGLLFLGFSIPAIENGGNYGFYGAQTAYAVLQFHVKHADKFEQINPYWTKARLMALKGESFGGLSVAVMRSML